MDAEIDPDAFLCYHISRSARALNIGFRVRPDGMEWLDGATGWRCLIQNQASKKATFILACKTLADYLNKK